MNGLERHLEKAGHPLSIARPHHAIASRGSCLAFLFSALLCAFACCHAAPASAQIHTVIRICSDGDYNDEFPPFAFYKRVNERATGETTGYSVEFIRKILSDRQIEFKVDLIPWTRCQAEVEEGSYALLLDAASSPEREKKYFVSKPYYTLQDVYFYPRTRPPGKVETASDLRRLRVCGQSGYTYVNWGLQDAEVDRGARTFEQALQKMKLGRCDVVLTRLETAVTYRFTQSPDPIAAGEFVWRKMPGMTPLPFHMMVSRKLPYSEDLISILNDGIDRMFRTGKAKKLGLEYLGR
jgi:polar amino acid transport system substrate-binding protein